MATRARLKKAEEKLHLWQQMVRVLLFDEAPEGVVTIRNFEHKIWHTSGLRGGWVSCRCLNPSASSDLPVLYFSDEIQREADNGDDISKAVMAEIRKIRGF